ncbi:MAG: aquaporin [Sphingobacteriaceae bacterium]|nr:aquaporin [Sphingobacteriaceae bacterium]
MKKFLAEVIGTFALVLFGTGAIVVNQHTNGAVTHLGISIAFGLIVTLMIFAFGKVSGAHMNPAVTIAFAVNKSFRWRDVSPYIIAQIIGALLASFSLKFFFPTNELLGTTLPSGSAMQSFFLELLLTFVLMLVIFISPSKLAAITIGLTVGLEAYFAGPICGASMNPARSIGPALISSHCEFLWLYIFAPSIGATLAVFVNKFKR